jgi:hypothetical protein
LYTQEEKPTNTPINTVKFFRLVADALCTTVADALAPDGARV